MVRRVWLVVVAVVMVFLSRTFAGPFVASNVVLPSSARYIFAWGDYNNDGWMDIAFIERAGNSPVKIYKNENGVINPTTASLPVQASYDLAWADYDSDGDLDLVVTGRPTKVFRNDGGSFVDIGVALGNGDELTAAWGDYDNDGDPDLAIGNVYLANYSKGAKVYKNSAGAFVGTDISITGTGRVTWCDIDNDGYLDLFNGTGFLKNKGDGTFSTVTNSSVGLANPGMYSWCDYDNDGILDLLGVVYYMSVYHNTGTLSFTNVANSSSQFFSVGVLGPSADFDNDGRLEYAFSSGYGSSMAARLYRVASTGAFVDASVGLPNVHENCMGWADYDNDGKLDLLAAGFTGDPPYIPSTVLYKNQSPTTNTPPSIPNGLAASVSANEVVFSWDASTDSQTPAGGLTYNIRVGDRPGSDNIVISQSNLTTGSRLVPMGGNCGGRWFFKLKRWSGGPVYWSVQSVDAAFAASQWAPEQCAQVTGLVKIGGCVRYADGSPLWPAEVSTSDGVRVAKVSPDGHYELWVQSGWSGSIAASRYTYTFSPSSIQCQNVTAELTGQSFVGNGGFVSVNPCPLLPIDGSLSVADYDSDGWLDAVQCGRTYNYDGGSSFQSQLIHNNQGTLSLAGPFLSGQQAVSSASWVDYDNDGDVDLMLSTSVYRNDGGTLVKTSATLPGEYGWWVDFDNDGRNEYSYGSGSGSVYTTRLYRYLNDQFVYTGKFFSGSVLGWADYDNDQDFDVAVMDANVVKVYANNNGDFSLAATIPYSYASWVDYNGDGHLDLCTGSMLFKNINGSFVDSGLSIPISNGSWADLDSDGDQDLLAHRVIPYSNVAILTVVTNNGTSFTESGNLLGEDFGLSKALIDIDNDFDLDFAAAGLGNADYRNPFATSRLMKNESRNTRPLPPSGLSVSCAGDRVQFKWGAGSDLTTSIPALTYNLRVGKTPGGNEVMSAQSTQSGMKLISGHGNVQTNLGWFIRNLPAGRYYWSVQSVDASFAPSEWPSEQSFIIAANGNIKKIPTDPPVCCRDIEMAVTAVFGDSFYAEDVNRMYGIRVDYPGHGLQPGDKAKFSGLVGVDASTGEAYVAAGSVVKSGSLTAIPFALCNRSLGGSQCGIQQGVNGRAWKRNSETGANELVWTPSRGLNNIAMLVRTTGMVQSIDPDGHYFYIDDGSGLRDGTSTNGEENVGVRVEGDGRGYNIGQQIMVTGISSCFKDSEGRLLRYLRVREKIAL